MLRITKKSWRGLVAPLGLMAAITLALGALVHGLAHVAWSLSDAGRVPLTVLEQLESPAPRLDEITFHRIGRWPADRVRQFEQAPWFDRAVRAGELPPVEERLPPRPMIITPPEQNGPYGGTWRRFANSPTDAGMIEHRIAFDPPVRWSPDGREVWPNVFRKWELTEEGRTYVFHLQEGVRWSDGHPFTTADIAFWYHHVITNPELTTSVPRDMRLGGPVAEFEVIDDHTFLLRFAEPNALLLERGFSGHLGREMLIPKHYLAQFHADFFEVDAGAAADAAAYPDRIRRLLRERRFEHWTQLYSFLDDWRNPDRPTLSAWRMVRPPPARPVVYERNPYYWKVDPDGRQLPYIDRIEVEIFDNEIINLRAIEGQMDMQFRHVPFANYPLLMKNRERGGYRVFRWQVQSGGVVVIYPNLNHRDPVLRELLHDRRFRFALSHAIDRDLINEAKFLGAGEPRQPMPDSTSPYYVPGADTAHIAFDPERANRLLDEMGLDRRHRDGTRLRPDGKRLRLRLETTHMTSAAHDIGPLLVEMWNAIGIRADVSHINRALFWERHTAVMHDILLWSGEIENYPPPDPRVFLPFGPGSKHALEYARWFMTDGESGEKPPPDLMRTIELYRKVENAVDPEDRIALFHEIIEVNVQNLWVIGTIGRLPQPVVVANHMRNVPEVSVETWTYRAPANTAPECYAMEREE